MIAYIQPFADGNKRTARMLANVLLVAYDWYRISCRSMDQVEHTKSVILWYEQQMLYHVKSLFVDQLLFANTQYFR